MAKNFFSVVNENPIIAAINHEDKIEKAIASPCKAVFLLIGDILNLENIVDVLKKNDKSVYVHMDLMEGLSKDVPAMRYINRQVKPDGIITTKTNLVKAGREADIFVIQRLFLLDSMALDSGIESIKKIRPNAVEILPGIMPKIVKKIYRETRTPIITGGLIKDKEDVIQSLNSGAVAISSSNEEVWYM